MKRRAVHNSGLTKGGLTSFEETFVQASTVVLPMNLSAKNPALQQCKTLAATLGVRAIFR